MFSFILFVGGVVLFVLLMKLISRVDRLEKLVKSSLGQVQQPQTSPQQNNVAAQQVANPVVVTRPASVPQALLDYINAQLKQGTARPQITSALLSNGWSSLDIENAFAYTNMPAQSVAQQVSTDMNTGPDLASRFASWMKEDWLMKLGALLLLIGFGWLTSYAFINGWIGPQGRIALGIGAGALFIVLGWWRIQKFIHQGGVFMVIGSTVILLTVFAAREMYGFFTPVSALGIMFLSTAFIALASVKFNNRALALASIILAGIAPMLTASNTSDNISLFSYLFVVTLGTVWIVILTGRRELTLAALIIVSLYSFPMIFMSNLPEKQILLFFAYAFSLLFFFTNTAGILKLKGKDIVPDLVTAAGTGLFLLVWIMNAAPIEWRSLIISAWMIVFVIGAFITYKMTGRKEAFLVYAGVGVAMLAAATSAELSGATLIIAFTIEAAMLSIVTYILLQDSKIATKVSTLLVVPAIMSIGSIGSSAWHTGVIHKDLFVLSIISITLLGLGYFFMKVSKAENKLESLQLNVVMIVIGSIYGYIIIWLSLHAALQDDTPAVMASLFVYTIVGLISYFMGMTSEIRGLKLYGGVLLGFVVGRLLLVDVWDMELSGRIVTFFIIGALLVSTAFFSKRKGVITNTNTQ